MQLHDDHRKQICHNGSIFSERGKGILKQESLMQVWLLTSAAHGAVSSSARPWRSLCAAAPAPSLADPCPEGVCRRIPMYQALSFAVFQSDVIRKRCGQMLTYQQSLQEVFLAEAHSRDCCCIHSDAGTPVLRGNRVTSPVDQVSNVLLMVIVLQTLFGM